MDLADVRAKLAGLKLELSAIGVKSLLVFGSVARGQGTTESDVDFLVEFSGRATFARYMDLKELLERELGLEVDLVTFRALKPQLRERILRESVRVA